ncbi:hypothetical protein L6164_026187 [Bauhinia variegata]|uniref:Uncharacterized protein n=1 Tax=Bauhinia variegata TaxID=167791 RepID=A0ACB9LQX1_BAUVA|nr:hypothetical protein L6164_026187 [Bauhinia variegata]
MVFNSFNLSSTNKSLHSSNLLPIHSAPRWKAYLHATRETDKPIVVNFTATWCGPCKLIDPVVLEFAAKYIDVDFIKIDVDEIVVSFFPFTMGTRVSQEFQVKAMPPFLLIKKGNVEKVAGARKEELQKMIEKNRM